MSSSLQQALFEGWFSSSQMNNRWGQDLISDLPVGIIEIILTFLPIRDAIRTSILSTKWRYRWISLPNLVFNEEDGIENTKLKNFITQTLLLHQGPIRKFALGVENMESCDVTDAWLLYLSRKDIKELILSIESEHFHVPSCLYSCRNLTHLGLYYGCEFSPPPPNFKGFLFLRTLVLQLGRNNSSRTFESIVANSPLLAKMEISLDEEYGDLDELLQNSVCNYTKFLGGVTNLESLIGGDSFTKFLSIGIEHCHHPLVFRHLKVITLHQVNFCALDEILVAFRLIMDAVNLQELIVGCCSLNDGRVKAPPIDLWDSDCPQNCSFANLEVIKMTRFCGLLHEMKFIKFLLESSPVLETIVVEPFGYPHTKQFDSIVEMLSYRRASTKANICSKKMRADQCSLCVDGP